MTESSAVKNPQTLVRAALLAFAQLDHFLAVADEALRQNGRPVDRHTSVDFSFTGAISWWLSWLEIDIHSASRVFLRSS